MRNLAQLGICGRPTLDITGARTHVHLTDRWLRVDNLARVEVAQVEAESCRQDLIARSPVDVSIGVQSSDPGLLVGAVHADAWRVLGCRLWSLW